MGNGIVINGNEYELVCNGHTFDAGVELKIGL